MSDNPNLHRLFAEAMEIGSSTARTAFVDHACGDDAALRSRLAELVSLAHKVDTGFLGGDAPDVPQKHESAGTRIGPYTLLKPIGEGGMGTVYLAEQHMPVRRQVALKIVRANKTSPEMLARFNVERQALAVMDHPNIAKIFDAGATESGNPYFVMELVHGEPITAYCDKRRLTVRDRLTLFTSVCKAINHAHQKGIIHRDIKPSNVLVTEHDGVAVPKVIDFGIAKAVDRDLAGELTQIGTLIGSLQYMSPEQANLSELGVDARSDIYSLGVLLYELLTGATPLDGASARMGVLIEVLKAIREKEPSKPSTRINDTKDELRQLAERRGTAPGQLAKQVRGELDWIAMKALDKDRLRRYDSAENLAKDVERFLKDEPIEASPPSKWYRLSKFVRRNKVAVGVAAAMLALVLSAGIHWDFAGRTLGWMRGEKFFDGVPSHTWVAQLGTSYTGGDEAMGRLRGGGPAAIPVLTEIATDNRCFVYTRKNAIDLLGRRQMSAAVPVLVQLLEDPKDDIRHTAARALREIGSAAAAAVPSLYTVLNKPGSDPKNPRGTQDERDTYADAIESIGGKTPVQNIFVEFRDRGAFPEERHWFSLEFSGDGTELRAHRGDNVYVWKRDIYARADHPWFTLADGVRWAAIHPNEHEALVANVVGELSRYKIGSPSGGGDKISSMGKLTEKELPVTPYKTWRRLAYSPDAKLLAIIRGRELELYDFTHRNAVPLPRLTLLQGLPPGPLYSVLFSADSGTIALLDDGDPDGVSNSISAGAWWLYDLKTGKQRARIQAGHVTGNQVALAPDGRWLAVNANGVARRVIVWSVENGKKISVLGDENGWGISTLACVDANRVAIGLVNGVIELWDVQRGKRVRELAWHVNEIQAMATSPDGRTLVSADSAGWVRIWDVGGENAGTVP